MNCGNFIAVCAMMVLTACVPDATQRPELEPLPKVKRTGSPQGLEDFRAVVRRVEPVAEQVCRESQANLNCDFLILVDERPNLQPNAYQMYQRNGRPVIVFTSSLLRAMKNRDEVAFALSHEAAHHIEEHILQTQSSAIAGILIGAIFGTAAGLDEGGMDAAADIGGTIGARSYSKEYELEADALGAKIAERAGYDALRGVLFFQDAADPGDRFLGTHPPNADRIRIVRRSVG
ncbi:MAG: M48 family metalloprotease [Boseongicola sp.]|nr:M48 family metalloprotease [Boseongicola sp.]